MYNVYNNFKLYKNSSCKVKNSYGFENFHKNIMKNIFATEDFQEVNIVIIE